MYFGENALSLDNFPNISAQEIQKICEYVNNISINESDIQILNEDATHETNLKKLCKKGDADYNKLHTEINKCAKNVVNTVKTEGLTKESKKKIHDYFHDLTDFLNDFNLNLSSSMFGDRLEDSTPTHIHAAITLLISTVIANTITITILSILFGPIGQKIGVGLIGPIIEELAKHTSIKGGYQKEFFVIFNAFEFTTYVMTYFKVENIILTRLKCIGLHLSTTIIQYIMSNPKIAEKLGAKEEDQKKAASFIGWLVGVCIHAGWNIHAVLSENYYSF